MRTLSATALTSMFAQQTDEVWLILLTITHASLAQPIRVVNNKANITSNGNLFVALAFEIEPPGEDPEAPLSSRLRIDNVDRVIVDSLRGISSAPEATIQIILASTPNTIEAEFEGMTVRDVKYDAGAITAELRFEQIMTEPITISITPTHFPGLF